MNTFWKVVCTILVWVALIHGGALLILESGVPMPLSQILAFWCCGVLMAVGSAAIIGVIWKRIIIIEEEEEIH